jgi:hypothetical protein
MNDMHSTPPQSTAERLAELERMRWADDGGPCIEETELQPECPADGNWSDTFVSRRHSAFRKSPARKRRSPR